MPEQEQPALHFEIQVPDELETGQFADFLSVWSGPHAFTLDFAVTGQAKPGNDGLNVPVRVVARIKVPHSLAPQILQALATNVTNFEALAGPIHSVGDQSPVYPPEDLQ